MAETPPWIARALSSLLALTIAAGLFAAASCLVSALMPLLRHVHHPGAMFFASQTAMMTGAAVAVVLALRRRKAQAEPEVAPLPRSGLPKAG